MAVLRCPHNSARPRRRPDGSFGHPASNVPEAAASELELWLNFEAMNKEVLVERPLPGKQHEESACLSGVPAGNAGLSDRVQRLEPGIEQDHRKRPCTRCPWDRRADLTEFSDKDMDMLRQANGRPAAMAPMNAPIVSCHQDQPGTAHAWRWCAGFLAVVGNHHLGVRLAITMEALPPEVVQAGADWPELFADLDELLAVRARQLGVLASPQEGAAPGQTDIHMPN
ncbi:DUF6283 family protein [Streptomyces sp. NPDC091416]|uniref:DUF6283 family protein n=1 Tax=Streptomyces sp. NPDC091416 TaxID=3366003 RepID=UPI0037F379F0